MAWTGPEAGLCLVPHLKRPGLGDQGDPSSAPARLCPMAASVHGPRCVSCHKQLLQVTQGVSACVVLLSLSFSHAVGESIIFPLPVHMEVSQEQPGFKISRFAKPGREGGCPPGRSLGGPSDRKAAYWKNKIHLSSRPQDSKDQEDHQRCSSRQSSGATRAAIEIKEA